MTDTSTDTARPEIRLTFDGLADLPLKDLAYLVMIQVERVADVVDPIVSADPRAGKLSVSFELRNSTGEAADDVRRAIALFAEAMSQAADDQLTALAMRADALTHPSHVEYVKAS